jgi:hypothetical protein
MITTHFLGVATAMAKPVAHVSTSALRLWYLFSRNPLNTLDLA